MSTISVKTADGQLFQISETVAKEMEILKYFMEEDGFSNDSVFPLLNVVGDTFATIVECCNKQIELRSNTEESKAEVKRFYKELMRGGGDGKVRDVYAASSYLNVKDVYESLVDNIAKHIKDMTVEQVRQYLCIENDFTANEEAKIRQENKWAFQ